MNEKLIVHYYTDILCVWAWIAQPRIEELNKNFPHNIIIKHHYLDIFGNTAEKIQRQWAERGSYNGFSQHVVDSAKPYKDALINADIWSKTRPASSSNAHLILKAVELCHDQSTSIKMALIFRKAFFIDALDISNITQLYNILQQHGIDENPIRQTLLNGTAMAELMLDYQQAKQQRLKGSPTYIIDNGRQILYGNVGYRVLHANIEEQLKQPNNEASWC
ncbi:MAG: disulfide bond formation protein DsbA [Gammaproteobacteria bacterium]|nr:MAG: disulfide bond formation protein DsbA [Gammaproteobacteria bacterium]